MTYKKLIILYIVVLAIAGSVISISNKNSNNQTQNKIDINQTQNKIDINQETKSGSSLAMTKKKMERAKLVR